MLNTVDGPPYTHHVVNDREVSSVHDGELAAWVRQLGQVDVPRLVVPAVVEMDDVPLPRRFLANVGDPYRDQPGPGVDSKVWERRVVGLMADLLRVPPRRRWGYVTSGVDESNLAALRLVRGRHRNSVVYYSSAAHPSVARAVDLLAMDSIPVGVTAMGQMDYDDLATHLAAYRHRPAVVVATAGTWSGAVDDVRRIGLVLDSLAVRRRHIHTDATELGLPLAMVDPDQRVGFDVTDGASSVAVGANTLLGCPFPCGLLVWKTPRHRITGGGGRVGAEGVVFETRNGHAPVVWWHGLTRHGTDGLRHRYETARAVAEYAEQRLAGSGWPTYRATPHSLTVMLKTPPVPVTNHCALTESDGWTRIQCLPGSTREHVDEFIENLTCSMGSPATPRRWPVLSSKTPPSAGHGSAPILAACGEARHCEVESRTAGLRAGGQQLKRP